MSITFQPLAKALAGSRSASPAGELVGEQEPEPDQELQAKIRVTTR